MKLGIFGCLAGSVAVSLLSGCSTDEYATTDVNRVGYTTTYATTTTATEPTFIERRIVTVGSTPRDVPIYRTGDTYFYTYGGRRYTLADYPEVSPLRPTRVIGTRAYSSGRYRTVDRTVIQRNDMDDVALVPATTRTTTIVEPEIIGEQAPVTTYRDSKEVVEIRE